jgi:hypothetical protein
MKAVNTMLITFICILIGTSTSLADQADVRADRSRYEGLLREINKIDAEYKQILKKGMQEAKEKENGSASLETKSKIIALTEKRDRVINRLTILSLRHGWEMPNTNTPETTTQIPDERQKVFEPAEQIIKGTFSKEASRIAKTVPLPLIPLESQQNNDKKKEVKKWLLF